MKFWANLQIVVNRFWIWGGLFFLYSVEVHMFKKEISFYSLNIKVF